MRITAKKIKKVFLPKDPDKAWVEIIYLKPGVRVMIEQEGNVMTATQKDGEMVPLLEMSRKIKRKMFFKEVIDKWGGFQDSHSNELQAEPGNFDLVNREIPNFYDWLQEESDKFIVETEKSQEKSKGN